MDGSWYEYAGQPFVIFDDVTPEEKSRPGWSQMKRLVDRHPMAVPVKGKFTVPWAPDVMYVTSNHPPEEVWPQIKDPVERKAFDRRFKVIQIHDDGSCDVVAALDTGKAPIRNFLKLSAGHHGLNLALYPNILFSCSTEEYPYTNIDFTPDIPIISNICPFTAASVTETKVLPPPVVIPEKDDDENDPSQLDSPHSIRESKASATPVVENFQSLHYCCYSGLKCICQCPRCTNAMSVSTTSTCTCLSPAERQRKAAKK